MILTEKPRQLVPAGTHTGILFQIIDLGSQMNRLSQKVQHKVILTWELPDEHMEDGRPFSVSKRYTLSLSEKAALTADLKSWLGQPVKSGFNMAGLLDRPGNITIAHDTATDGKIYANVAGIAPLKKGEKAPDRKNPLVMFDLSDYRQDVFDGLPDFLKDIIKLSPEYAEAINPTQDRPYAPDPELNDEIPLNF